MDYLIAIDSGGTKTDAVLFDEAGHVVKRCVGLGCNGLDIGRDAARFRMLEIVRTLTADTPGPIKGLYGAVAGTLYIGDAVHRTLEANLELGHIHIEGDGLCMITGMLGPVADGCAMVCGTGSSLFVRKDRNLVTKIGGKGYLIDTGGAGFELGRDAICMAIRACDHRCKDTVLVELISKAMGKNVMDSVPDIYHPVTGGRAYVASFAHTVFEGRSMGDWACEEIFNRHAWLLADLTHAAEHYFSGEFPVVMNGGLFRNYPEYVEAVKTKASPRARMILGDKPPIYGAAVTALYEAGIPQSGDFHEIFMESYRAAAPEQIELLRN